MDSKTKSIILGVAVVVGMAIILFPFFQNSGEVATSTTLVKAPPFPDQAVQVQASEPVPAAPVLVDKSDTAPLTQDAAPTEEDNTLNSTNVEPIQQESPTPPVEQEKSVSAQAPEPTKETPKEEKPAPKPVAVNKVVHAPVKIAKAIAKKVEPIIKRVTDKKEIAAEGDDGLFSLKNPAWVVQLGSFKNKANALRLVNELRANGYSAFIQRFSSTVGDNTRVYVGPEKKPEHARQLASHIESNMHMHGIVISYKPLTL